MQDVGLPQPKARPEGKLFLFNEKMSQNIQTELILQILSTWTWNLLFESCTICLQNTEIYLKFAKGRTSSRYNGKIVIFEKLKCLLEESFNK